METLGKGFMARRLAVIELTAFLGVIVLLWLDELIDIPFLLLGAEATPVNWRESLFETLIILPIALATVWSTRLMVKRLRHLEGFLSICASCKKIRDKDGNWQQLEAYIRDRSEAEFSHGICPDCARRLYPDLFGKDVAKPAEGAGEGRGPTAG